MAAEPDNVRTIAERIARQLGGGDQGARSLSDIGVPGIGAELSAMRASLVDLQRKLASIESRLTTSTSPSQPISNPASTRSQATQPFVPATHSPWLGSLQLQSSHPSQERFGVEEAAVAELVDFFEGEKTCELEPGGKPCDHCEMCSSRGF